MSDLSIADGERTYNAKVDGDDLSMSIYKNGDSTAVDMRFVHK
jgi:hypothetical protein